MEQKSLVKRLYRSPHEILKILDEYAKNTETIKEFCQKRGIDRCALYRWRQKYINMLSEQPDQSDNNDQQGSFATIQIRPGFARPDISLFAEVKGIRIYQPVSASYLKELAYE